MDKLIEEHIKNFWVKKYEEKLIKAETSADKEYFLYMLEKEKKEG